MAADETGSPTRCAATSTVQYVGYVAAEIQTLLGEVLRDPERFPWDYALYAHPDRAFDLAMPVLIWDVDDVEEDSDIPAEATALGFDYVLGMQTVQGIVSNALQQRPEASIDQLLEALDFYYRNDAFVVWN